MRIKTQTCGTCCGTGIQTFFEVQEDKNTLGYNTAVRKESKCNACDGNGYIEYAVFEVEEAKAILKYCGIKGVF